MKVFLALSAIIAVCSAGLIPDPVQEYKEGDRFFYFPGDGDGKMHLVDMEDIDENFLSGFSRHAANNEYHLYTRANPSTPQYLYNGDEEGLKNSNFDASKQTIFVAHGWNGHGLNDMSMLLVDAFLVADDVNVVVLCWRALANRSYATARKGVADVGRGLGQFIIFLTNHGLSWDDTHLVGFSLGGHLVGNAGRETEGRVKRITALDPAGPAWSGNSDRLLQSDGRYVEVIHTNTGFLGYTDPIGDADFYPNGGSSMPGCWISSCSHGRAYEYMASTVKYNHLLANECQNYREANRDRCTGDLNPMGNNDINKNRSGIFRVNTERRYPY